MSDAAPRWWVLLLALAWLCAAGAALGGEAAEAGDPAGCSLCQVAGGTALPTPGRAGPRARATAPAPVTRRLVVSRPTPLAPRSRGEYAAWNGAGTPLL